jgi:outer membrane protein TolC
MKHLLDKPKQFFTSSLLRGEAVVTRMVVCSLLIVLSGAAPGAQQPPAPQTTPMPVMEFDAVIRQALDKNPTVARAATNITRAETLLQQSRAITLPLVTTTIQNTTLDSARGFAGGITQPQNQLSIGASANMAILNSSRWAQVTQARDQVGVAEADAAEIRQQVVVAAAQTFLAVNAVRRQVDVSERAIDAARAHLDYATKRFEGGAGSRLNQLRAAQAVSSEETRLEVVRMALRSAQEALGVIIAAPGPIDAGADPVFDMTGAMDESAWAAARPDLLTQIAVQRAAERVVKDSWRDWVPIVNTSFDPGYVTPAGLFQPAKTWRLTFLAIQPIYEGGQRKIALRQRQLTLDQSKIDMTALEINARSEVRLAQETLRSRERTAVTARRAADEASEVLRITTAAFEVGATTNLEVIDAQREDLDAKTAAETADNAVLRARLDLLVSLGRFK